MSAYLCSDRQLSAIVHAACAADRTFSFWHNGREYRVTQKELFKILFDENVRSLQARYGNKATKGLVDGVLIDNVRTPSAIETLALCNTYDYQACESADWESTLAFWAIYRIKEDAVRNLPGYKGAGMDFE